MTRPQFDATFAELYECLIRHATRCLNRDDGPDMVHAVYCQVVTSEAYLEQRRGKKEIGRWLMGRVALQVKQQKRNRGRRREAPLVEDDGEDEY